MEYIIGLDFGTESVRGVLLDARTGAQCDAAVANYRHGVLSAALPGGQALAPHWALQHAPDYTEALQEVLNRIGRGRHVLGIGVDCTASSPLPTLNDGSPLSELLPDEAHAYVKLWKHHAAQAQADYINARAGDFLRRYGGRTSSEWSLAKAMQMAEEAPALWQRTQRWIEAGDWIVWQLTGNETRSGCQAGYKAHYQHESGYPTGFLDGYLERMQAAMPPMSIGNPAGELTVAWRERCGVLGPAVVAVAVIDAHAVVPAVGVTQPGILVGTLGTSACYLLLHGSPVAVPGISGVVRDGAVPGLWCYEAGQPAFGDALAWFAQAVPRADKVAASLDAYAAASAALPLGADRLLALDWWNGCRCPHADTDLSGMVVGLALDTTTVEIFRAIENSLCFGARQICDNFTRHGVSVTRILMTSGVAARSPTLMQRMADVFGQEIHVPLLAHATAIGAAIHAAVAAGVCTDFAEAATRFGAHEFTTYTPQLAAHRRLDELYAHYCELSAQPALHAAMHTLRARSV